MKRIIIFILLVLCNLSTRAQTIIPTEEVEKYMDSKRTFPKGTYFKDVNLHLDKFIGTWQGTYDDKIYKLKITKFTELKTNFKEDVLLIRYLITKRNGAIIKDTRALPNSSPYVIKGYYLDGSTYVLSYYSKSINCEQAGTIFIDFLKDSHDTIMTLFFEPEGGIFYKTKCEMMPSTEIALRKTN